MSSINPNNIDGTYPIAGQDNDSQGFRDNFTNIKNNLTFAKTEIEDLQGKVVLKGALAGTTLSNELNDTIISGAQLVKTRETINELGSLSGSVTVDWADAHFQTIETGGSISLTFTGWPTAGRHARMRLQIDVQNVAHTLTLPAAVSVNNTNIQGESGSVITFPTTGKYLFEFGTYDSGASIYIRDLLRNYDNISPSSSFSIITVDSLANITSNTASTSATTGALKIVGGAGIQGNIHSSANIVTTGNVVANVNVVATGNIVAGNKFVGTLVGNVVGTSTNSDTAGTVTNAAQANITSVGTLTSLTSSGTILSSGGAVGYTTGAGGAISQGSGSAKNTTVTLNKLTGTITLDGGICLANAVTANSFTLTNSTISATDIIVLQHQSVGSLGAYTITATPGSGSAQIYLRNITQSNLSEAIVLRFAVIKSSNS